jgi:predicted enzyme related to lactoylglutathione lyase
MPEITKHEPGMFCWSDLGTTDVAAAKKFYSAIFGWSYQDDPMGPDQVYSRALVDGKDVCAIYAQQQEQAKMGIPPHWASYIAVTSADDAEAKAGQFGGKAAMPAFDVFDAGRMTVVMDPSGAAIGAWQAGKHIGARVSGEPGTLCWTELMTNNIDAAGRFYCGVFGWSPEAMPMPSGTYTVFKASDKPAAGMMAFPPEMQGIPPHWMVYFQVAGADATVAQATSLGAKVYAPPQDIPGVGRFAVLADPQGVAFAILQPAPQAQG